MPRVFPSVLSRNDTDNGGSVVPILHRRTLRPRESPAKRYQNLCLVPACSQLGTSGNKLRLEDWGQGGVGVLCLSTPAIRGVSVGALVDCRMSNSVTSLYLPNASGTCPSKCDKHKYL